MKWDFKRVPIPTLAMLVLLPLFLYLGYWQLQRAEEKRALQAEYDRRAHDTPVSIGSRLQRAEALRFYKVIAKGYYETNYQVLLDNRVHLGRAGYHVITPLHIKGSDMRVLVNRGWVPLGEDRKQLPALETPKGQQVVTGVATVPMKKVFMLAEPEPIGDDWQTVWQHLDMKRYSQAVPFPVQPAVILLDPASPAGGFTREWSRLDAGIAVHQGYAFQWFTLAVALLAIYFLLSRRNAKEDSGEST